MPINSFILVTGDCQSISAGSAKVIFNGGTPPYTANWISPSLGADISITATTRTGLSAGTYVVLVNDSTLPENQSSYINIEISSGVCVSSQIIDTTCGLDNGQLSVSATTNASFTEYILYSAGTFVTSGITDVGYQLFTSLTAGTYQVIVKDIGGCTASTETLIIHDSQNIDYGLYVIGDTSCYGPTGKIFITGCTGHGPYTYLWSNGETTQNITGLTAGTYSVTVSNSEGCSVTKSGIVQTIPPPDVVLITAIPPTCFESNGEVTIFVTGGTEPFYYSGSNGYSIISYSREFTLTGLTSGNYAISVTDCSLCNIIVQASVQAVNTFNIISINTQNSYCGNKNGSIDVSVQGGSPLYTYTLVDISGNTQNFSTNSTQYTFVNLDAGEYTVFVKDNSGCIYSEVLYILTENKYTISASTIGTTCGNNNGSVTLSLTSGGTAPYNYTLSNGGFLNNTSLTNLTFNNLPIGQYTAIVTDSTNCTQSVSFYISAASQSLFFTLAGIPPQINQTGGTINALITSGEPPFTLNWSNNVGGQTGLTVTGLTAGTYSLSIVDSNDCTLSRTLDLKVTTPFVSYEVFNMCNSSFLVTTNTKNGILQMTWDGFSDITGSDYGCVLNSTIFTTKITVSGVTYQYPFYTGTTLNDVPTDDQWKNSVAYLLNQIPGIGSFSIDIINNIITIKTECDENLLGGENLIIDLKIDYDISCQEMPTPTPSPTPTATQLPCATWVGSVSKIPSTLYYIDCNSSERQVNVDDTVIICVKNGTTPYFNPSVGTTLAYIGNSCVSPTPTPTSTQQPTPTGPTPTPTASTTQTPTPTASASPTPTATEVTCLRYTVYSFGGGTWSGTECYGNPVSGPIPNNGSVLTDCIVEGSLVLNNGIVITTSSCVVPTPTPTEFPCISIIDTVIAPFPQSGIYNYFGVNVGLNLWGVDENVTVSGYIRDDDNSLNRYYFSLTINSGTQSAETANNVLQVGPASSATIVVTGVTPNIVTYAGNPYNICGYEPTPTPTPEPTPMPTETPGLCTQYDVQPSGPYGISVEWFSCGGSYLSGTYFSPTSICAETGTLIQTGGSGTITPLYYCIE